MTDLFHSYEKEISSLINSSAHFIFDSQHVDCIEPRLYGFCVTREGLFTEAAPKEDISDAMGAWVLVRHTPKGIEISQDSIGCFGLFLFRDGDYWALSNSFNHLLDYLKTARKLSINRDYADALLAQSLCVSAYGETIIREIDWLDRRAQVLIDTSTAKLEVSLCSLGEYTIPVDTEEGIHTLDEWHSKWATFFQRVHASWPGKIRVDLSGGFDTRMAMAPILSSGIDMNCVRFNSHQKNEEDYRIASLIAEEFGFSLNENMDPSTRPAFPPIGSFQERALSSIFFEKEVYTRDTSAVLVPTIAVSGFGGGMIRGYWRDIDCYSSFDLLLGRLLGKRPLGGRWKFGRGTKALVQRSVEAIDAMLLRADQNHIAGSLDGQQFYMETRNRTHFGMSIARSCLSQSYRLAPLLDPLILKLRTPSNEHSQLIVALIFTRYHEKLAIFPIEGSRTIPEDTLQLARKLNERYSRDEHVVSAAVCAEATSTWQVLKPDVLTSARPADKSHQIDEQLVDAFDSPTVQRLFKKLYGTSTALWTNPRLDARHPNANKYAAVVVAKAMEDVRLGKDAHANLGEFTEACRKEPPVSKQSAAHNDTVDSSHPDTNDSPKHVERLKKVGAKIKRRIQQTFRRKR